jgi:outer membrane receptor for ferrienterochelin and colicins
MEYIQDQTLQGGIQFNHKLEHFLNGMNVLTVGTEYVSDKVFDEIDLTII